MAHDHKTKTHVPSVPGGVDALADMAKAMHMHGQISAGHYKQLPTTQRKEGNKTFTTIGVEEVDPSVTAVTAPV